MLYTEDEKYKSNFDFLVKSFWGSSTNKVSFLQNKSENNKKKSTSSTFFVSNVQQVYNRYILNETKSFLPLQQ